jgi:hypothetical protein
MLLDFYGFLFDGCYWKFKIMDVAGKLGFFI